MGITDHNHSSERPDHLHQNTLQVKAYPLKKEG